MQSRSSCWHRASSAVLLLALLAAAAASVSARPSKQLLGANHHEIPSSMPAAMPLSMPGSMDSKHAVLSSVIAAKLDKLEAMETHHKEHKEHKGKSPHLPLAIHMDEHIPAAVNPNPSNPPMSLPNPSQPPMMPPTLPAIEMKHTKLSKHEKKAMKAAAKLAAAAHVKLDHDKKDKNDKFDHHDDLPAVHMPTMLVNPNPSQPPMMPLTMPAIGMKHDKLTKHEKKAMKAAAKLVAAASLNFDHHDKHGKFDHKFDHEMPAVAVNPNPSMPPMTLPNPSQPPMMPPTMPAVDLKHDMLSKHDKKAMKAAANLADAAKLAAAAGVNINQVAAAAGVNVADIVMRNEPRFQGPTLLG
jgi:hypothetical protein